MKKIIVILFLFLVTGCFGQSFEKRYEGAIGKMKDATSWETKTTGSYMGFDMEFNGKGDSNGYYLKGTVGDTTIEFYAQKDGDVYTVYIEELGEWYKIIVLEEDLPMYGLDIVETALRESDYDAYLNYNSFEEKGEDTYVLKYTNKAFLEELELGDEVFEVDFEVVFDGKDIKEMSFETEVDGETMISKVVVVEINNYEFSIPDKVKNNAIEIDFTN